MINSSGRSATSGSRLFISMRRAASCCQPLQVMSVPRGARTGWYLRPAGTGSSSIVMPDRAIPEVLAEHLSLTTEEAKGGVEEHGRAGQDGVGLDWTKT